MGKAAKSLDFVFPGVSMMGEGVQKLAGLEPPELPKFQPPAAVDTPTPMPIPDDESARKARRRSLASQRQRSGRASTIFTEGQGLGG